VVVTNPDSQAGTQANGFTVTSPYPAPVITGLTPGQLPMTLQYRLLSTVRIL